MYINHIIQDYKQIFNEKNIATESIDYIENEYKKLSNDRESSQSVNIIYVSNNSNGTYYTNSVRNAIENLEQSKNSSYFEDF